MKRILLSLLVVGALTACGGGGGGSTPVTRTTATPTVAPTATPTTAPEDTTTAPPLPTTGTPTNATLAEKPTQQSDVNQGLTAVFNTSNGLQVLEQSSTSAIARRASASLAKRWHPGSLQTTARVRPLSLPVPGACEDGVESGTLSGPGANEEQILDLYYYDVACTNLEENLYEDITLTSSSSATSNVTIDIFAANGTTETGYLASTLTLSGINTSQTDVTEQDAISLGKADPAFADRGSSCSIASTLIACGASAVVHATADSGFSQTYSLASGATDLTLTAADQVYAGALNALAISQGSFPAWGVTGATSSGTTSASGTFSDSGVPVLTYVDAANDATFTLSLYGNATQGILRQTSTGTVVDAFNVNGLGNGAITYGDGSTGLIQNYFVVQ